MRPSEYHEQDPPPTYRHTDHHLGNVVKTIMLVYMSRIGVSVQTGIAHSTLYKLSWGSQSSV